MIATVRFEIDGTPATAILGDDGVWTCHGHSDLASTLDSLFPLGDYSPAHGQYGMAVASAVAIYLGGSVSFPRRTPPPADARF